LNFPDKQNIYFLGSIYLLFWLILMHVPMFTQVKRKYGFNTGKILKKVKILL